MSSALGVAADLRHRIVSLTGVRRWAAAFVLGAIAAAAQPPVHLLPVLVVSFTGLVWLLDGAHRPSRAFLVGWMFGAGYFAAGLYWVSNALLVDAATFAWLIPFAVLGLSFGLGLFIGGATLAAGLLCRSGLARICVLAAAWTVFEWIRGVVFTGFPWNPIGNVWVAALPVLQAASWIGVYGLSLATVFAAAAFAVLGDPPRATSGDRGAPGRAAGARWVAAASGLCLLAAFAAAGAARLAAARDATVAGVSLRIVQPNIAQRDKWRPDRRAANYAQHIRMSAMATPGGRPTHVIWPETATSFRALTVGTGRDLVRRAVPPDGLLLTGTPRFRRDGDGRLATASNSIVAIDGNAGIVGVYDKSHLVPFGEYVPFRDVLPMERITPGMSDFSPGPGRVTLNLPGLPPFSPLICYEAIFPGAVARDDVRPAWLLNVTNDAWFGHSAGPYQHFASARLRAVEEGLPLVRAANTGISAVTDGYGRVVARLGLERRGVLDAALPAAVPGRTPFSRFGNAIPLSMAGLLIVGCLVRPSRRPRP